MAFDAGFTFVVRPTESPPPREALPDVEAEDADDGRAELPFGRLNLSTPLLKACRALGYRDAMPIQAAAIPLVLAGRDVCGSAITGSGKTVAFGLPLLERLLYRPSRAATTYVVMIAPTRELAVQIHEVMQQLAQFTNIQVALIVGGFSLQVQAATLDTHPEIVVATPGRLIDHLRNSRSFDLDDVHAVVLDEADKLLKMGFINEIKEILKHLPKKRQTLLFSATMSEEVQELVQHSLQKPVRIAADPWGRIPRRLTQEIIRLRGEVQRKQREAILCALCARTFAKGHVIIFCATKRRVRRVKRIFEVLGLAPAGELHADMSQNARLKSLEKFRNRALSYLVATDLAGRGLDVAGVEVVINYDAPRTLDTYLHRIGRTARAGAEGQALTFATDANRALVKEILDATQEKLTARVVPPEAVAYYEQQLQLHQRYLKLLEKEEKEEAVLQKAEREVQRAKNVLAHEKEIFARPPRTWFQTKAQRNEAKILAKNEEEGSGEVAAEPKRRKPERDGSGEDRVSKGFVRAAKKRYRMVEERGSTPSAARKLAVAAKRGRLDDSRTRPPPRKQRAVEHPAANERREKPDVRVYAGGSKSGRLHRTNVVKRRGKHVSKGRRKYKRR